MIVSRVAKHSNPKMPIIDPEELVEKLLLVTQEDGETTKFKIIET